MRKIERASDVIEILGEKSILTGFAGVAALAVAAFAIKYQGLGGNYAPIQGLLVLGGIGALGFAGFTANKIRSVAAVTVVCPYCNGRNELTEHPDEDVRCTSCQRMVPILSGKILSVEQVRCGYCNALNYYSEKTEVLLCEDCNREVPISRDDDPSRPQKKLMPGFAVSSEEDSLYDLVLVDGGPKQEEMIDCLQHMLALNRNQVKNILNETPALLLTGISHRKAEMLKAQISMHDGNAQTNRSAEVAAV
ncbi:hypothetical protein EON79_01840 [bacterium]|nr:MAG: hypothetical protein EON79_01840 [bacterium]